MIEDIFRRKGAGRFKYLELSTLIERVRNGKGRSLLPNCTSMKCVDYKFTLFSFKPPAFYLHYIQ